MTPTQKRVAKLQDAWSAISIELERAVRWRDRRRVPGLATALALVDAAIVAEEGSIDDQAVMARLREIARERNIFEGVPLDADAVPSPAAEGEAAAAPTGEAPPA